MATKPSERNLNAAASGRPAKSASARNESWPMDWDFWRGPAWHRGELWFSDFFSRRVSSVDLAGVLTTRYYVPGQPSGLAPLPDGDVLIASVHNGRLLRGSADGSMRSVADIGASFRGALNDLVVDTHGRAYVSTLPDLTGVRPGDVLRCPIILVDEHGETRVVADDLRVPNGMVITPDGRTLIAAETQGYRLIKFAVAEDGSLGAPEVFAELGERKPDGIALDPTGAVWVCCPFTSEVLLVAEGGAILASASTPGSWAVACAVGGERRGHPVRRHRAGHRRGLTRRHGYGRGARLPNRATMTVEPLYDFSGLGFEPGQTAVVSGAASGIGRSVAGILARSGVSVLAWDINEDRLEALAQELASAKGTVTCRRVDTSVDAEIDAGVAGRRRHGDSVPRQ